MVILGISGGPVEYNGATYPIGYHDCAACLIQDGRLIAGIEEERFTRVKKGGAFPVNAIRSCLEIAGFSISDVDAVAFYFPEEYIDRDIDERHFVLGKQSKYYSRHIVHEVFRREFDWEIPSGRLVFVSHHVAHALPTFIHSGMDEALILVLDGAGEHGSGTIFRGRSGDKLEQLHFYPIKDSLGFFYLAATVLLGYGLGDEYKVMGLAPHGDPSTYRYMFEQLCRLKRQGDYELYQEIAKTDASHWALSDSALMQFQRACLTYGIPKRTKGCDFTKEHKDFAASLQETLERTVLHVLSYWSKVTGLSKLCFSGGVAHNSSLNGAILRSGLFNEVFVHPASHDAGAAEGSAFAAALELGQGEFPREQLHTASVGPGIGDDDHITRKLTQWGDQIRFERSKDIVNTAAHLLSENAVIGWASGRSEFGPRALGNRSILADPSPPENQTRINSMIKKRESFRPFAPVVAWENAEEYFDIPTTAANYDFMSYVVPVRQNVRDKLGAVTHVDGTARIQVIKKEANDKFYSLVKRFGQLTGTPVLLNTSFNNNAEPIVQTVDDAITCFLTTEIDYLIVEDFLIKRVNATPNIDNLVVTLRPGTKLIEHKELQSSNASVTRSISHGVANEVISHRLFEFFTLADGCRTVKEIDEYANCLNHENRHELIHLWQERYILLHPKNT